MPSDGFDQLVGGLKEGLGGIMQRREQRRREEVDRQRMMDLFRQRNAMTNTADLIGPAGDRAAATEFLAMPPESRAPIDRFLDSDTPTAPIRGMIPEMFTPQETQGARAARTLKQEPRVTTPPGRSTGGGGRKPWNSSIEMARALSTVRGAAGPRGKWRPMDSASLLKAIGAYDVAKQQAGHGPITKQESDAIESMGQQAPGGVRG